MTKRRRSSGLTRLRLVTPYRFVSSLEEAAALKRKSDEALLRFVHALAKHDEEQDFRRAMAEQETAERGGLNDPPENPENPAKTE